MEPRVVYCTVSSKPHRKKTDLTVFGLMHTVRCGFDGIHTVRFGAVFGRVNPTIRFGAVIYPTVGFGAVFRIRKCYGAGSVRFSDEPYGAVRLHFTPYILRCGSMQFSNIV